MVTAPNHELLQETYANYRYQVVLEPEAIGWALAGGLLLAWIAEVLMASVAALVGLGDNRRASRRHWN